MCEGGKALAAEPSVVALQAASPAAMPAATAASAILARGPGGIGNLPGDDEMSFRGQG